MVEFAKRMEYMKASAAVTKHLFESMTDPSIISFGGGAPAKEALPVEELHDIAAAALSREGRGVEALQYGKPMGLLDLRQGIIDHLLTPKGIQGAATVDNIMIFGGGMEGLYMTGQAFLDKDDVVLVESPTFVQSIQSFEMFQARCIACETDENGYIISDVEKKIKEYAPKLIYVIPTFQNPTGRTTALDRRKALAKLAKQYDVLILEDDPYGDMRYSGSPIPPVKAFDENDNIIYANSLSKIFSPGSRLGYVYASTPIIEKLYDAKTATNSHTGMLSQVLCAEFFNQGYFEPHLKKICDIHKERRDVMMDCLKTMFPKEAMFVYPDGGLFSWVELPEHINTTQMLKLAMEEKVSYMPGEKFFTEGCKIKTNCMRLSFGGVPPETIRVGMERLAAVVGKMM